MIRDIHDLLKSAQVREKQRAERLGLRLDHTVLPVNTVVEVNGQSVRLLKAVEAEYVQQE